MAQPDLLDRKARPRGGQVVLITVVALAAGAGATWLTRALDASLQPGWPLALGIGGGVALGVIAFAMQGSRVVVGADRVLTYSLHGRPNLAFDLGHATAIRVIEGSFVRGVGVEFADPRQVRFLHKGGVSPERMRQWREAFGIDLLLEGFDAGLADELRRLGAGVGPSAG